MFRYIGVTVVIVVLASLLGVRVHVTYEPEHAVIHLAPIAQDALMTASDTAANISEDPAKNGAEVKP